MKFCGTCGKAYEDELMVCPHCGAAADAAAEAAANEAPIQPDQVIINGQPTGGQQQYSGGQQYSGAAVGVDNGGFGWGLLGFCIPLVGLILYLVWKDEKPKTAKAAGLGALISVGVSVVFYLIAGVLGVLGAALG